MDGGLDRKIVLLTGGTSKLGRPTVESLIREGARVVFTYHRDRAQARDLVSRMAGGALAIRADVTRRSDCVRAVERTLEALGRLDALVNNAGLWWGIPFDRIDEAKIDALLATNLRGTLQMVRAALPALERNREAAIVNFATSPRNFQHPGAVAYAASKGGVYGFTKALARELAPKGIRVNAVAPGFIPSREEYVKLRRKHPPSAAPVSLPFGRSRDVAGAVLYFLSDLSRYVTGQILAVDGGVG